jgi:hypothetical protein
MNDNQRGLYCKYLVRHADGTPLSPGLVFVLRPDRDPAAWNALREYALSTDNHALAGDLLAWLSEHDTPG